jgi:ABC-type uncharacterized transport system involved in gliding motility auxiliary subunit
MSRYLRLLAPAGILALAVGGIGYAAQPVLTGWAGVALLLGAGLLLAYFLCCFQDVKAFCARRATRYGGNVALMVGLLLGIIVLVELLSAQYNKRFDLTEGQRHTLSDQTLKLLRGLKRDVTATAFYRADQPDRRMAEELMRRYADVTARFKYQFVDPDRSPALARRYGITQYATTVLEVRLDGPPPAAAGAPAAGGAKAGEAKSPGGAAPAGRPAAAGLAGEVREEKLTDVDEEKLTNALVKATREGRRAVYLTRGHGELDADDTGRNGFSAAKGEIAKANYEVKELSLLREQQVPDDAAIVVLAGPKRDLHETELKALKAYLERGGKALFLVDPWTMPGLKPFLIDYGIKLGDDVIVDRVSRVFGGDELTPVIQRYYNHPITRDFKIYSLLPYARSVDITDKPGAGVSLEKVGETEALPASWAETDRAMLDAGRVQYDAGTDRPGPVPIGAIATIGGKADQKGDGPRAEGRAPKKARLVVYGNSAFASNRALGAFGNRDLFMNTIAWLAEEEDLISIRPREARATPLYLTAAQGKLLFVFPVILIPAAVAGTGAVVVLQRRRGR